MSTSLSQEERLLVLAARVHLDTKAAAGMASILGQDLDWPFIMRRSKQLGVQPLLHRHLSQAEYAPLVPEAERFRLREAYREQSIRNLWIYGQIDRILDIPVPSKTPVVLLKGAYLAKWVYRDMGLRPMNDIDLLCRTEDADTLRDKLFHLGFSQEDHKSPLHESLAPQFDHLPPFFHPGKVKVEVHLNIFSGLPHDAGDMKRVWERTTSMEFENLRQTCLSPEDLLLQLTLHLSKHIETGFPLLYWFCDIHEVVSNDLHKIDWDRFTTAAESLGVGGRAGSLLRLLRQQWETPVPEEGLKRLGSNGKPLDLAEMIPEEQDPEMKKRKVLWRYLRLLKRVNRAGNVQNRLAFLWKTAFPPRAWIIRRYAIQDGIAVWFYRAYHVLSPCKKLVESIFFNMVHTLKHTLRSFSGSKGSRDQHD